MDERLREYSWMPLEPLVDQIENEDTVIVCAGFEDRATALLENLTHRGIREINLFVVHYLPDMDSNRVADFDNLGSQVAKNYQTIVYDRTAPEVFDIDSLALSIGNGKSKVVIDVSAMSRLLITQLISGLMVRLLAQRIFVVYCEAQEYPPQESEVSLDKSYLDMQNPVIFLSTGVFRVLAPPDLGSFAMVGEPVLLVASPSFNPNQLSALRSDVAPSRIALLNGVPPSQDLAWRPKAIRKLNAVDRLQGCEEYSVSTLDYRETIVLLSEIYCRYNAFYKLVVSPTGSKMQAVAIGIFRSFMQDIQIVYPAPKTFAVPQDYTRGVGTMHWLTISSKQDFSQFGDE